MISAVTLETLIICLFSLLWAYALYTIKRFIDRYDKDSADLKTYIEAVDDREKECLQRFATKEHVKYVEKKCEKHTVDIAILDQWTKNHDKHTSVRTNQNA